MAHALGFNSASTDYRDLGWLVILRLIFVAGRGLTMIMVMHPKVGTNQNIIKIMF